MVDVTGTTSAEHYSITARPNCSLSPGGTLCLFFLIAAVVLVFSSIFALIGAWLVLPFVLVELLGFSLCFLHVWRHARDYERLTIDDDKVIVETHAPGYDRQVELSGYWARVVLECRSDGYCRRLALRSYGKEVEFGHHLSSEERLMLATHLRSRLGGYRA